MARNRPQRAQGEVERFASDRIEGRNNRCKLIARIWNRSYSVGQIEAPCLFRDVRRGVMLSKIRFQLFGLGDHRAAVVWLEPIEALGKLLGAARKLFLHVEVKRSSRAGSTIAIDVQLALPIGRFGTESERFSTGPNSSRERA